MIHARNCESVLDSFAINTIQSIKKGDDYLILEKVKKLCEKKGISVNKLEDELRLGNSTICKWNESSPRVETLIKVADYFGVSLDYFRDKRK